MTFGWWFVFDYSLLFSKKTAVCPHSTRLQHRKTLFSTKRLFCTKSLYTKTFLPSYHCSKHHLLFSKKTRVRPHWTRLQHRKTLFSIKTLFSTKTYTKKYFTIISLFETAFIVFQENYNAPPLDKIATSRRLFSAKQNIFYQNIVFPSQHYTMKHNFTPKFYWAQQFCNTTTRIINNEQVVRE